MNPYLIICILFLSLLAAPSAEPPDKWEKDIAKFEAADKVNPPAPGGILFVGSSSIRKWKTDRWFPGMKVVNRGFGGSQISDVNHFVERVVLKYRPSIIAFYAGDNDINKKKSAERVFQDYQWFLDKVAGELPETQVVFIAIKPSLKRWELWPEMNKANQFIREHCQKKAQWHFADTATPMLGPDGRPKADLLAKDKLHLSEAGYRLWSGVVRPFLEKAPAAR